MSITNENFILRLEELLGKSYDRLTSQTDRNDPSSAAHIISKAKNMIRGGFDYLYGPIPPDPITGITLEGGLIKVTTQIPNTVVYPTISVLINGGEYVVPPGTFSPGYIGPGGKNVQASYGVFYPLRYSAIIGVKDISRLGNKAATVDCYKFSFRCSKEPGAGESVWALVKEYAPASYPRNYFVPIAVANVTATYVWPTHALHMAAAVYDPPIGDDDQVTDLFAPLNDLEDTIESLEPSSNYRRTLDQVLSLTRSLTSMDFKEYWKSRRFKHDPSFRRLFAKVYNSDPGVELASYIDNSSAVLTMEQMYAPGNVEFVTLREIPAAATVTNADLYLCNNLTPIKLAGWVHPNDATLMVSGTHSSWPQAGFLFARDPYSKAYFVASYAKTSNPNILLAGNGMITASVGPWVEVYNVEKVAVVMGTGMPTYAKVVVTGDYTMLVGATLTRKPMPTTNFIVRSA